MSRENNKVPNLRFPEFRGVGEWEEKRLGEVGQIITGKTPSTKNKALWSGNILFITPTDINEEAKYQIDTQRTVVERKELNVLPVGSIVYTCIASIGKIAITTAKSITNQQINSIVVKSDFSNEFLYYSLINLTPYIKSIPATSTLPIINKTEFSQLRVGTPTLPEQQKIADCLSSLDDLITAQTQKLAHLKTHKKGLMQQLFPAEGETQPKLRFPEFQDAGEWEEKELADILDYQQPTPYLVASAKYNDSYRTPVLTAGKTFLLGYTNEETGIFDKNLPTIIFDDFTTAFKYVDFPFKAKSSAMKMLIPKNNDINLQFVHAAMNLIRFPLGEHKRYWISEYQWEKIGYPTLPEQQKIADCLSSLDELITAQTQKLAKLKTHKKGLMQQLFPAADEVNG